MERFKAQIKLGNSRSWLEIKHDLSEDQMKRMYEGWLARTKVFTSFSLMRYIEKRLPNNSCINLGYGKKTKKNY